MKGTNSPDTWSLFARPFSAALVSITLLACGSSEDAAGSSATMNGQSDDGSLTDDSQTGVGSSADDTQSPPDIGNDPDPPNNGQTGSPGSSVCSTDEDCLVDGVEWTLPLGTVELRSARCDFIDPNNDTLPVCHCELSVTPSEESLQSNTEGEGFTPRTEPYDFVEYAGHRGPPQGNGCSVFGRTPECSYCASEFPGCQLGDDAACDAPCAQLAATKDAEFRASYSFAQRVARCMDGAYCEMVVELDGKCYAAQPSSSRPAFDCSLPDDEIIAHRDDLNGSTCAAEPAAECQTADDCPSGLACNAGRCGPCADTCSYPNGQPEQITCEGDVACATGEVCASSYCLLEENVECRTWSQCADGASCVLSGIIHGEGRGNELTRSFCSTAPQCPEEMRDEDGNLIMPSSMVPGCF